MPTLTAPQCLAAGTCCPQKRELPQAGGGGEPEHPTAHTVGGAAQTLLGRGSVSRRQGGLCHGWQVSVWLRGLSSQVSTQPSQREPGKATFKAWGEIAAALSWACTFTFISTSVLPEQHRSCSRCMRLLQPLLWLWQGRKAPGSSSPTWQTGQKCIQHVAACLAL